MLPVISAAPVVISVASAIGASAVNNWRGLDPKTRKLIVYALGGTALFVGGRALYNAIRKAQLLKQGDKPEVQQALAFIQGLDPYGMFGWGTDEKLLMNTATEVKDWPAVISAYKAIAGGDLLIDLKGDLSTSDYAKLIDAINASKDAQKGIVKNDNGQALETGGGAIGWGFNDAPNLKGKAFISNQPLYAFPDPAKVSGTASAYSATLIPVGQRMGWSNGKLYKGKLDNGSPYVMIQLGTKRGAVEYHYWVSMLRVKQVSDADYQKYPLVDVSYISSKW